MNGIRSTHILIVGRWLAAAIKYLACFQKQPNYLKKDGICQEKKQGRQFAARYCYRFNSR